MNEINNVFINIDVNYYINEIKKDISNKQFISALAIALLQFSQGDRWLSLSFLIITSIIHYF